jgi:glutaredoxin
MNTGPHSCVKRATPAETDQVSSPAETLVRWRTLAPLWLAVLCLTLPGLLLTANLHAQDQPKPAPAEAPGAALVLQVFVKEGCPHCAAAKEYLAALQEQRQHLNVVLRSVDLDAEAAEALLRYSRTAGVWPPGVPTFVFDERVLVGFTDAERSGPEILALIDHRTVKEQSVETGWFGLAGWF